MFGGERFRRDKDLLRATKEKILWRVMIANILNRYGIKKTKKFYKKKGYEIMLRTETRVFFFLFERYLFINLPCILIHKSMSVLV